MPFDTASSTPKAGTTAPAGSTSIFKIAAGHVDDLLGEVQSELVEDILLRPGALPAHRGDPLRLDDIGEAENCRAAGGNGGFENISA